LDRSGFVSDRELLIELTRDGLYQLARLDLETMRLSAAGGPALLPEAHVVDGAGRLCVGSIGGTVRRFDSRLVEVDRTDAGSSVIVLEAEPGSCRLVASTADLDFFWLDGGGAAPKPHRVTNPVFTYERTFFTPQGSLYASFHGAGHAFTGGECSVFALFCGRTLNRFDLSGRDFTKKELFTYRARYTLPTDCVGITAIGDEVLVLGRDGRLRRLDYHRCPIRDGVPLGTSLPEDPIDPSAFAEISSVPGPALGLAPLGPGEIATWTTRELTIVTIDPVTLAETGRRIVPDQHVTGVKPDPRCGGVITAHLSHLSFFTANLEEHLRMLPLGDDTVLWHAPPPPHLGETGHPGFFWREQGMDSAFLSAFRVVDNRGQEVQKPEAKRAFLGQYFSHELVVRASRDWSGYVESLERTRQRIDTSYTPMLCAGSGGDSRQPPANSRKPGCLLPAETEVSDAE
jgi:hypothetical protein